MVTALLNHAMELLQRLSSLEIMIRTDEHRTAFMSDIADSLRHLLLRLDLNVHISCTCLNCADQFPFSNLHSLYLTALLRHRRVLESRIVLHHIRHTTGSDERHVRREHLINILQRKITAVKAHLRHLTLLQGRKNTLQILIYNSSTNHNYTLFHQSHNLIDCEIDNTHIAHRRRQHEMHLT